MAQKIFISYRRQDAGANALGISQYLEHEFGRRNVFIDVDMRAGTKFPVVLEQRLAECKVMLVLMGPEWVNSTDEDGGRRLDNPHDWVRLEIAHALNRNITIIPVRVNNTSLPNRESLPAEIRGLLDHQAVSVTLAGFRHEMAGLARDIHAIPSPRSWKPRAAAAAAILLTLGIIAALLIATPLREKFGGLTTAQNTVSDKWSNGIWESKPGDWVHFANDTLPVAYYFQPSTVHLLDDRVLFITRYPIKSPDGNSSSRGVFDDDRIVLDCKSSSFLTAERTIYDRSGEVLSHFQWHDPKTVGLTKASLIPTGSVLSAGAHILCDEQLRRPLAPLTKGEKLKYVAPVGDADLFYALSNDLSGSGDVKEVVAVFKYYRDRSFSDLFPGQNVIGLPATFGSLAQLTQVNCKDKKVTVSKSEYSDRNGNLEDVIAPVPPQIIEVKDGSSALSGLVNLVCASKGYAD